MGKLFVASAVLILAVAVAVFYLNPRNVTQRLAFHQIYGMSLPEWTPHYIRELIESLKQSKYLTGPLQGKGRACVSPGEVLFTPEQLKTYDGTGSQEQLLLAYLGRVYDVSSGAQHYRPGGGYSFFAGKDGTRAFITGDFTPAGLVDDLRGLDVDYFGDVQQWLKFYNEEYQVVGRVIGNYYDSEGCATQEIIWVQEMISKWEAKQAVSLEEDKIFPPCNTEWSGDTKSGRVWCSKMSGGISRDWVGVPRQLFTAGGKKRCACVRESGIPSLVPGLEYADDEDDTGRDQVSESKTSNVGDLSNPRLAEYPGCDPHSVECKIQD